MTNLLICVSITKEEEDLELTEEICVILPLKTWVDLQHIKEYAPTFDPKYTIHYAEDSRKTDNFSTGTAEWFLNTIANLVFYRGTKPRH